MHKSMCDDLGKHLMVIDSMLGERQLIAVAGELGVPFRG